MLYVSVAYLGDVYKPVLMHTDVNKSAEIYYIADCSGKYHPFFKRCDIQHIVAQHRSREAVAYVASGLFKLGNNVAKSRLADAYLRGDLGFSLLRHLFAEQLESAGAYLLLVKSEHTEQLVRRLVGFGVDTGRIQHLVRA